MGWLADIVEPLLRRRLAMPPRDQFPKEVMRQEASYAARKMSDDSCRLVEVVQRMVGELNGKATDKGPDE